MFHFCFGASDPPCSGPANDYRPQAAPGRAVPVGRGPGEVHDVASGVLLPVHAANWIVPHACHAVKRIDGLVLPRVHARFWRKTARGARPTPTPGSAIRDDPRDPRSLPAWPRQGHASEIVGWTQRLRSVAWMAKMILPVMNNQT